jgi:hypothetical protein
MSIVPRHVLRLMGIGAFAIAIPQFALASDSENSAPLKLAMGPMSAAQKNQGESAKSDAAVIKPHHRSKHRHAHSAR